MVRDGTSRDAYESWRSESGFPINAVQLDRWPLSKMWGAAVLVNDSHLRNAGLKGKGFFSGSHTQKFHFSACSWSLVADKT